MKIRTWTVSLAVLVAGAANVKAETSANGWSYDQNVKGVAFASDCCEPECGTADPCCGDPSCGDGCDCGSGCCGGIAGAIEGFSLAGLIGLPADSQYQIGGWTEAVYTDNNVPLSQAYNDLLSFDDTPDNVNIGQQWFYMGRTLSGDGFDIGGRIDAMYGVDAQKTQAFGNPGAGVRGFGFYDASWDHGAYGFAMPQTYVELGYNNVSVKVGHFFTPLGYEVIPVTGNFFRTHSYTMYNSEPFTHTGALAQAVVGDFTFYGGWSLGWDTGYDQLNQGNCLISGFAYAINENVTFTYLNTYGNFGWRDGGNDGDDSYSHAIVLVASLTDNLQYIAQSDMVDTNNPGISEYDTIGLNQYLLYWLTDSVGVGGRVEWWKADGVSFYEATSGFNFKVLENVNIRPEFRQDWAPGIGLDEDTFAVDAYMTY